MPRAAKPARLTPLERLFALAYVSLNFNATKAAAAAGYAEKHAKQQGHKLVHLPHVAAEIEKQIGERAKHLKLQAQDVLEAITRNALAAELKGDHHGALRGWELIGKHLKLFTEKHEHTGTFTLEALVCSAGKMQVTIESKPQAPAVPAPNVELPAPMPTAADVPESEVPR